MRHVWIAALVAPLVACGVDGYLTCGAPCEDGGGSDATIDSGDSGDASKSDAPVVEAGCKTDGGFCQKSTDCCSGACNANNHCASGCASQGNACSGNGACCIGTYCSDGGCVACLQENVTCTEDPQCCSGSCVGGADGGPQHCDGT